MKQVSKRKFRRVLSIVLVFTMLMGMPGLVALAAGTDTTGQGRSTPELKLWYDEPATQTVSSTDANEIWQQATLPIGDGDLGANVYGEIGTDRLTLNEKTLWNGGPSQSRPDYIGGNLLEQGENGARLNRVRQYFFNGNDSQAISEAGGLIGQGSGPYGTYLTWGELQITNNGVTSATQGTYQRWLSLDDAVAGVEFQSGGTTYTREYFVSNPNHVLVAHLTASQSRIFTIALPGKMPGSSTTATVVGNDTLKLCGQLTDNQLKYASFLKAVPGEGTTVSGSGSTLTVTGTEVTLYFSAATDYKAVFPTYRSDETDGELAARVLKKVTDAADKGYEAVKADHLDDYHSLFDRINVDVGQTSTTKTTDQLMAAYKNGSATAGEQRLLEMMIFQYGRYLTISSSRENSILPANLQGVWNNRNNPPWMSDYHTNVNLQINYWPTYSTNLAECADSLIRFTESLREPGRTTAKIYAGIESTPENPENGFMAHTQTTPYGYTTPGWEFNWGWSPASIAWLIQNCWEYYEYTGDLEYMRNNIYPIMREYCRFYDQFLFDKTSGKTADKLTSADTNVVLASVPAYSPETGPRTMGNTFEHSLIWQLYEDTMTAAKLLNVDSDRIGDKNTPGTWLYNQSHLQGPIEVGASGQVKEWFHEVEYNKDANGNALGEGYTHRHISHMVGIYPGDLIQTNEEWIEAARVSMNNRNDTNTGWSMTHRANVWARLRDGNHAHKVLSLMVKDDKIYSNLWDTHPPFQIDGNFGYTAAVSEMLLQSNMGFIDLLPALPDAWANGSYRGLVARGNFEISAAWTDSSLTDVSILSKNGGECVVRYPNLSRAVVKDSNDNIIEFEVLAEDKISFPSAKGAVYTITKIPTQDISKVEVAGAYRTGDDTAEVFWTAKDGESYQVYRQIAGGDILPVSDIVTEGHFLDEKAYLALGEITYFISVDGKELSDAIPLVDMRNQMFDDDYSAIEYSAGSTSDTDWDHYDNHNEGTYMETVKFVQNGVSSASDVGQTIEFTFYGTGIQVIGGWNTNHGQMSVEIDGTNCGTADFYGTRTFQKMIWEKTDLARGLHTIKLTRLYAKNNSSSNYKIEFDAFKVLDDAPVETPDELEINTVGNVEKLWNAGDTVQFTANLEGVTWTATSSEPHATTCDYPEHKFSWNANTQTLTAGLTDEVITVTATKGSQTASKQITITPKTTVTIIEDSVSHSGNTGPLNPDPRITSGGGGTWSAWWGEQDKHHGSSKTENSTVGAWLQLDFEGTDVAVYGTIHFNNGAVSVLLDDEAKEDIHPCGDTGSTDLAQKKLAEYTGLTNGSHTLKLTVKAANNAAGASKSNFVLDFFEVHAPNPNAPQANLEDLKAAVAEAAAYNEESYTADSWKALADALATAGRYLNNEDNATQDEADTAAQAIRDAIKVLEAKPLAAPENVKEILVEGTAVTLKWDPVTGATGYEITVGGKTYESTTTTYRVTGLESGVKYSFIVKAVNDGKDPAEADAVTVTTLDTVAPTQPTGLVWNESTNTLTWNASTDNVDVTGYQVLVNGAQQGGTQTETSKELTLSGTQNTVTVIAVDEAGNESVPAKLVVAPTYTVTAINATIEGDKTRFKAGEAVTVTATVPKGSVLTGWSATGVTLSDDDKTAETVTFSMPAGSVSLVANVEEKSWGVTAELTNLYSDLGAERTVPHGEALTVTLTAYPPYKLPTSVQVVMGGQQLQSPWVTYNVTKGVITVREVTGDVVITAENAPQTPEGTTFTATDPFQLPTNEGDSTKLEAEYMQLEPGTGSSLAAVYGPNFGNKQLTGFVAGDEIKLYYNAEYPGTYTLTLRYSSAQTADTPHRLNWSGENVEDQTNTVESTLEDGTPVYRTEKLEFTVTEAGPGVVTFNANAPAGSANNNGGPDMDSMTFTLDKIDATPVNEITLDKTQVTLYLSGAAGEDTATLTATVDPGDANNQELRWSSDKSSIASVTQEGVVSARSNGTAIITAIATDGSGKTATATVTVKTRVTGTVTISGQAKYGQTLVASVNQISNQSAQDTLAYQWNRDGVAIDGKADRHYTVTEADIDHDITVTVTAADPYVGSATSAEVTVTKADGPDVTDTLDATDFTDTENGKITGLNAGTKYEYKLVSGGEDDWEPIPANSTEFEVAVPGSYHVRVAASEDKTTAAGAPSGTLTILAANATGEAIHIGTFDGGVVRADVNKADAGDTVTLTVLPKTGYQLKKDSLLVNDGDVTVTAAADGTFTFAMPAGEATVTAEFELKTYEISHNLTDIGCDLEGHDHKVTHGAKPTIIISAEAGYDLPHVITMTLTESGAPFTDYEYDYEYNNDTVTGLIVFTNGIPGDLTISGAGIKKSLPVIYALYGLTSLDGARSVEYHDALSFTITPKTSYTLPNKISITMGGEEFSDFTYTVTGEVATVTIGAGKITGELTITAEGTSELPSLALVEITGTAMVGQTLRAVATPANVFPDYRWIRVDSDGNEFPIYGATNRTYVITTEDKGYAIKVAATGAGIKFGNTIYSAPTEIVENANVVATTGVTLNMTTATVTVGGNALQLTATVQPANASNKAVTWKSSDESKVFVTSNGAVFGRDLGTVTVTVTTVNGSKTATCTVTVVAVSLPDSVSVRVGGTTAIKATVPEDLSNKTLTWSSDDKTVATVDENGVVTGVKAGTATITVTTGDGYTADCTVKVSVPSASTPATTTTTGTRDDGSTVTTVTDNRTGTVTETVEKPDGTVETVETKKDGTVTETVIDPEGAKTEKVTDPDENVTITVTDPEGEELAKVEIPAEVPASDTTFVDTTDHWARESIDKMAALKLVKGVGEDKYKPTDSMTRGSLATVLHRLSQGKTDYATTFRDVDNKEWYAAGVAWAAKADVVRGVSDDLFAPDQIITREQLATMLCRYAKLIGMNTKADAKSLESFVDDSKIGGWAVDSMAWCVENGILQGKGQNNLDPTADVTRAEVAVMLDRFISLIK